MKLLYCGVLFCFFFAFSSAFAQDTSNYFNNSSARGSGINQQDSASFQNDRFFVGREKQNANGQTLYYNSNGQQVGRAEVQGDARTFYTDTGAYTGYSRSQFDRSQYYNEKGEYTGYSVQEGDLIRHYSSSGEYLGYSQMQDGITLQFDVKDGIQGKSIQLDQ